MSQVFWLQVHHAERKLLMWFINFCLSLPETLIHQGKSAQFQVLVLFVTKKPLTLWFPSFLQRNLPSSPSSPAKRLSISGIVNHSISFKASVTSEAGVWTILDITFLWVMWVMCISFKSNIPKHPKKPPLFHQNSPKFHLEYKELQRSMKYATTGPFSMALQSLQRMPVMMEHHLKIVAPENAFEESLASITYPTSECLKDGMK